MESRGWMPRLSRCWLVTRAFSISDTAERFGKIIPRVNSFEGFSLEKRSRSKKLAPKVKECALRGRDQ